MKEAVTARGWPMIHFRKEGTLYKQGLNITNYGEKFDIDFFFGSKGFFPFTFLSLKVYPYLRFETFRNPNPHKVVLDFTTGGLHCLHCNALVPRHETFIAQEAKWAASCKKAKTK